MAEYDFEKYGERTQRLVQGITDHFRNDIHGPIMIRWIPTAGYIDFNISRPEDRNIFDQHGWDVITHFWGLLRDAMFEDQKEEVKTPWSCSEIILQEDPEDEKKITYRMAFAWGKPLNIKEEEVEVSPENILEEMNAYGIKQSDLPQWQKELVLNKM